MSKKENKNNEQNPLIIPFVKPVRVGNYKVWRSRISVSIYPSEEERQRVRNESAGGMKSVGRKMDMEAINVSDIAGSWKIQIPQTASLFSVITEAFNTVDENIRNNFLCGQVFSNMEAINTCGSVVLHHSFNLLFNALNYPFLFMTEKEITSWVKKNFDAGDKKKRDEHIENLLRERKEFYEMVEKERKSYLEYWNEQRSKEKERDAEAEKHLDQDEIAEQAMNILDQSDNN